MNSVVSANSWACDRDRVGGKLCYQSLKGDKEHKVATLLLLSQEAGWLVLSLVCYLTQHSCKQTRLEMKDRFSFKIEHETKAIFFFCHCGQMEMPAQGKQFQTTSSFYISLNYLFKIQNSELRKAFRYIAMSTFYGWNSWELWRRNDLPPIP